MQDITKLDNRKQILDELFSEENKKRKFESFRRSEVYNKRQDPFINAKLVEEFSEATVADMRKIYSINIAKRVTDKIASVYQDTPERVFTTASGKDLTENELDTIKSAYDAANVSYKLQRANRIKTFQHQCVLQVVPVKSRGVIDVRVYHPHQIDVVPMADDPELPFAYIVSAYDRSDYMNGGDGLDQRSSDRNDGEKKKRSEMRFVWWTAEHNMITDGNGVIAQEDPSDIINPIGVLPFVDISEEKENEFWVRKGSDIIEFTIDFSAVLSDTATINRLQGYAQGVIKSVDKPKDTRVGPNAFIWLQLDPNSTVQPELSFATPNPDMQSSLDLQDRLINYFLTARGLDPKVINSKGESQAYSSGFDRLLAMIEQFSASKDDVELFRSVEREVFALMVKWVNVYAGAANSPIKSEMPMVKLPEDARIEVVFAQPEMLQSKSEIEDSELKLLDAGLRSKVQALMNIDNVSEAQAIERLTKAVEHDREFGGMKVMDPSDDADKPANDATQPDNTDPAIASAAKVADTALNGAQVTAMVEVVSQVSQGLIPRESAVSIMEKAFLISREEAERLIGPAGKSFTPNQPEPVVGAV